jgi:hypothetical protein
MTYTGLEVPEGKMNYMGYAGGPVVVPGDYQVRLTVGEWSHTEPLTIQQDPRLPHVTEAQLVELRDFGFQVRERISEAYQALETIASVREQAKALAARAEEGGFGDDLKTLADSMVTNLEAVEEELYQTKAESGQDMINFPPQLSNQLSYLYGRLSRAYGPPTAQERARLAELAEELAMHRGALQAVLDSDLAAFNAKVEQLGIGPVVLPKG